MNWVEPTTLNRSEIQKSQKTPNQILISIYGLGRTKNPKFDMSLPYAYLLQIKKYQGLNILFYELLVKSY